MENKDLEKSHMSFMLPSGDTFLLHNDDIKKISQDILNHIITMDQGRVLMLKDTGLVRAQQLYELYQKEKSVMSEKLQQDCLLKIVKFLSENDYELTTLKNAVQDFHKK